MNKFEYLKYSLVLNPYLCTYANVFTLLLSFINPLFLIPWFICACQHHISKALIKKFKPNTSPKYYDNLELLNIKINDFYVYKIQGSSKFLFSQWEFCNCCYCSTYTNKYFSILFLEFDKTNVK